MKTTEDTWQNLTPPPLVCYVDTAVPSTTSILAMRGESTARIGGATTTTHVSLEGTRNALLRQIDGYGKLTPGWDGYQGTPFTDGLIHRVKEITNKLVISLARRDRVPSDLGTGPASDGSIDVECEVSDRSMLFTLQPDSDDVTSWVSGPDVEREGTVRFESLGLEGWVAWLVGEDVLPPSVD